MRHAVLINHVAETRSRAVSRCDMTTCGMRASTNRGTDKKGKRSRCCHTAGHGDTLELNRICWTLKTKRRKQGSRNLLDTFHPRDKRCHVCRDFTAARCDHRATGNNLTGQRLQSRTCLFIPCNAWPDASVKDQKQVSAETYRITCWVQFAKLTHRD